jgi:hypothetical protein
MLRALVFAATLVGIGCDTVDLGGSPADVNACRPSQTFFVDKIWPEFLGKSYGAVHCYDARCHDPGSGRALVIVPPTTMGMVPLPPDWAALYRSAAEQTQCTSALSSPLVTRPDGRQTHGGGMLIQPGGPEEVLVQMWVTAP